MAGGRARDVMQVRGSKAACCVQAACAARISNVERFLLSSHSLPLPAPESSVARVLCRSRSPTTPVLGVPRASGGEPKPSAKQGPPTLLPMNVNVAICSIKQDHGWPPTTIGPSNTTVKAHC
eukprot:scaffold311603_cov35-Tisochrysis_lutea.AAC.2